MRAFLAFLILLLCLPSHGATVNAASPSSTDVQAAITASAQGDTIIVPAGFANWSTTVRCDYKTRYIKGSGGTNKSALDVSTWINWLGDGVKLDHPAWNSDLQQSNFVYLTGFKFSSTVDTVGGCVQFWSTNAGGMRFRCSKNTFVVTPSNPAGNAYRGLAVVGIYGLVDQNYFIKRNVRGAVLGQGATVTYDAGDGFLVKTWENPQAYGDTNTVVFEDNVFDFDYYGDDGVENYSATKAVFRFNSFTNTGIGWHGPDSDPRGCRMLEVYGNTFTATPSWLQHYQTLLLRSGTGVICSNLVIQPGTGLGYQTFTTLRVYRANTAYGPYGNSFMHLPAGGLQGYANGSRSVDGNIDTTFGYPAIDQVGRGSFPGTPWPVTWPYASNATEALEPLYLFNNTNQGAYYTGSTSNTWGLDTLNDTTRVTNYIKEGRDVYDGTIKPGWTPLSYPAPLRVAMDGSGPALTPPQLNSVTVGGNGTSWTFVFNSVVSFGAGGNGGWTPSMSGGAVTLTYSSGSGSATLVYTGSRNILGYEFGTIQYVQPGNGVEDAAGTDLLSLPVFSVINSVTTNTAPRNLRIGVL